MIWYNATLQIATTYGETSNEYIAIVMWLLVLVVLGLISQSIDL